MMWVELDRVAPNAVEKITDQLMRMGEVMGEFAQGEFQPVRPVMHYLAAQMLEDALATEEIVLRTDVIVVPDDDGER